MHVPFVQYWLLEVERDAVKIVLSFIQSINTEAAMPVIRASDLQRMEAYIANASTVLLIKPLISEAPLQRVSEVMTITAEKLIVDLLADTTTFFMYQEELPRIIGKITAQYVINQDKLRRYARRRNQLPQLYQLLDRVNAQQAA